MVSVPAPVLRDLASQLLHQADMSSRDAEQAADVLIRADLRGVDPHGVSRMLRVYLGWLASGPVNPSPSVRTVRERWGTATLDADQGIGVVVVPQAMRLAIDKASAVGIGMVSIRNSRHLGMAACHAMMALTHRMIGVCTSAVDPLVVPTFGAEPRAGYKCRRRRGTDRAPGGVRLRRGHECHTRQPDPTRTPTWAATSRRYGRR